MKFEPKKLKFVHEFPEDREWLDERVASELARDA